jgi:hypothetical protein
MAAATALPVGSYTDGCTNRISTSGIDRSSGTTTGPTSIAALE